MIVRCHSPFEVTDHSYGDDPIPVPCGNCAYCTDRRADEWSFRLMQEDKVSNSSYFVTLTYQPDALPKTKKGFWTLDRDDLRNYFKRLRQYHAKTKRMSWSSGLYGGSFRPLKYYAVGEYGSKGGRPHYHAIIFNAHPNHINDAWMRVNTTDRKNTVSFGAVHIGSVSRNSCRYVMKYMMKDLGYRQSRPFPFPWDGINQFCVQSKYLGESYLTPAIISYHRESYDRNFVTWPGGYKTPLPRYYRNRIWKDPDERQAFIDHVVQRVEEEQYDHIQKHRQAGTLHRYYRKLEQQKTAQRLKTITKSKFKVL